MKKLALIVLSAFHLHASAQQTITDSIMHDGIYRSYILYVPTSYTPGTEAPLVLNFHGYTSNAAEQMFYGDFRPIADTAGFLLVHPQGTLDGNNQPYWNSDWGGTVDDIGFTNALIDSLSASYSINQARVYSTGMSNGGFMSYTLACSLSNRIAAIASVTGTMNIGQTFNCNPQHPMPVMEIHGTADGVVPYSGNATMMPIQGALNYWVNTNVCDPTPIETSVPNINLPDGCTATHFRYINGNNGVEIEHFRINNGGHTWPGAPVAVGTTNYDIDASIEIWRFFSQYDIYGRIVGIEEQDHQVFTVYPNPAKGNIQITSSLPIEVDVVSILNSNGQEVLHSSSLSNIDVSSLSAGFYFVRVQYGDNFFNQKFMIE